MLVPGMFLLGGGKGSICMSPPPARRGLSARGCDRLLAAALGSSDAFGFWLFREGLRGTNGFAERIAQLQQRNSGSLWSARSIFPHVGPRSKMSKMEKAAQRGKAPKRRILIQRLNSPAAFLTDQGSRLNWTALQAWRFFRSRSPQASRSRRHLHNTA